MNYKAYKEMKEIEKELKDGLAEAVRQDEKALASAYTILIQYHQRMLEALIQ